MGLLSVFANFRIDSEERLLRMQDSFRSFSGGSIDAWIINVRGSHRESAAEFLTHHLGNKLTLFMLDSRLGWFHDSRQLLPHIHSDYVFFWIEDNLCVSGPAFFDRVVQDMASSRAEYLMYTAFHAGDTLRSIECLRVADRDSIAIVDYDRRSHRKRMKFIVDRKLVCPVFIVSVTSIFTRSLFERLVIANDPLIKRWPREAPFDFEKTQHDLHWLPIRVAYPKQELFAYIDDDHGRTGHSLISRGLYPDRMSRAEMVGVRDENFRTTGAMRRRPLFNRFRTLANILHSSVRRLPGLKL